MRYSYLFIYALAIFEGPIVMTLSGVFLKLGVVRFWPVYLVLMAGDTTADLVWYWVGRWWAHPFVKKYGRFFGVSEQLLSKTQALFNKHHNLILFFSKITMGFGFALLVLITAGMMRVPLKKYIAFNLLGQFIWTGILLLLGYWFGNLYLILREDLRLLSIFAFIILFAVMLYGFSRYLKTRGLGQIQ